MVTVERRDAVRAAVLAWARADERVTGAAVTGSSAAGTTDAWSDTDVFLGVAPGQDVEIVLADLTRHVYAAFGAMHHFDVRPGGSVYRAFLLADLQELDVGVTTHDSFGPIGSGAFDAVFGDAVTRVEVAAVDRDHLVGLGWHHVLHARSAIERGRPWQAEHWIGALRGHVLTLACARLGLPTAYAAGADRLPAEITDGLAAAVARDLRADELRRALRAATAAFADEVDHVDGGLAVRLRPLLTEAAGPAGRSADRGLLHHVEVWVPDLAAARPRWEWLLGELAYTVHQQWDDGVSYRLGATYVVFEQSPALTGDRHERTRPGLNHLAFHGGTRADVDRLVEAAPANGWRLMFADKHPFAGGPDYYAAFLEDDDGYEVEVVADPV